MLINSVLSFSFQFCVASAGSLLILDTGVGHRSTPIPRWRTSLRGLTTHGTNATILQQYGPASAPGAPAEPIMASSLAYSTSTQFTFLATGTGIIRTNLRDEENILIVKDKDAGPIASVVVSEREQKVYFSTRYGGLIKRADFDGSNVEVVRNVSQGINYGSIPSYTPAKSYADGILVDLEKGWLYWSASRGTEGGSIRRAPLNPTDDGEQILANGLNMPGQLRLLRNKEQRSNGLWWAEKGRWSTSPTSIKVIDLSKLGEFPDPKSPQISGPVPVQTLIHSKDSNVFLEKDYTGEAQTLSIQSYVYFSDGITAKVWLVIQSSGRTTFGKLVEVTWKGSGDGRKAFYEVLNQDTREIGVPVGLEYIDLADDSKRDPSYAGV